MTIMGRINTRKRTGMVRGEPSRKLSLEGASPSFKGMHEAASVFYLSTTGMLLETDAPLSVGEPLEVLLPQAGNCMALIVWANESLYACQFDRALTTAVIGAVKLVHPPKQSDADLGGMLSRQDEAREETFGERLSRLRREAGFTMVYLASLVGVSKPTLWKWEKDAIHPRQRTVQSLARALGVSELELLYGTKSQLLQRDKEDRIASETAEEAIAISKAKVADIIGVDPAQVRIIIEA